MPRSHSSRGVTLVELLIAAAILSLVLVAATGALLAQNRTFIRASGQQQAREQGTVALDALESAVRQAGFGIDPQLAFDFDYYNCAIGGGTGSITGATGRCAAAIRDSATQPDELVVYYRDPNYSVRNSNGCDTSNLVGNVWQVKGVNSASQTVTLAMRNGDILRAGQILQIMCMDAATYTYVTVTSPQSPGGCGDVTVQLAPVVNVTGPTGTIPSPFSRADLLTAACFGNGSARAFKVVRNHFFVRQDTTVTPPRPFLMLDQGLDIAGAGGTGPDGVLDDNDLVPIASDVEDMQISYVLDQVGIMAASAMTGPTSTYVLDNGGNGVWGDNAGAVEQLTANITATAPYNLNAAFTDANSRIGATTIQAPSTIPGAPCFNSILAPYTNPCLFDKGTMEVTGSNVHAYRWLPWTGNITEVRIALATRGALATAKGTDLNAATRQDIKFLAPLGNRAAVDLSTAGTAGWYGAQAVNYQHSYFSGAVRPINMVSSGLFIF